MSFINRLHHLLSKSTNPDLDKAIQESIFQIPYGKEPLRLTVFCDINSEYEYRNILDKVKTTLYKRFIDKIPAITLVAQKPLDCTIATEICMLSPNSEDCITYKCHAGHNYVILENKDCKLICTGGLHVADSFNLRLTQQAKCIFDSLEYILGKEGMTPSEIVRQWNYIGQITAIDSEGQRYQEFNNVRSDFYGKTNWANGYPAATGIGMSTSGLVVDAVALKSNALTPFPVDNPLQTAAHSYSDSVLALNKDLKTTPKFERAKQIVDKNAQLTYVSGTAAIRGEESINNNDVLKQLDTTIENLRQMTSIPSFQHLRIYLKKPEDYHKVKNRVETTINSCQPIYSIADVCRDELLIEIEGVSIQTAL